MSNYKNEYPDGSGLEFLSVGDRILAEEREEGRQEGRQKGRQEGFDAWVAKLRKAGMSDEQIRALWEGKREFPNSPSNTPKEMNLDRD